jgi:hypothetical protein
MEAFTALEKNNNAAQDICKCVLGKEEEEVVTHTQGTPPTEINTST